MGFPVFVSSSGMMTNHRLPSRTICLPISSAARFLGRNRNKGNKRGQKTISVTDGIVQANWSARCRLAFLHQPLPKVEQLEARNDGSS